MDDDEPRSVDASKASISVDRIVSPNGQYSHFTTRAIRWPRIATSSPQTYIALDVESLKSEINGCRHIHNRDLSQSGIYLFLLRKPENAQFIDQLQLTHWH